jgi:hypothetical protein
MKRSIWIICLVLSLGLVLSACQSAPAEPAPAEEEPAEVEQEQAEPEQEDQAEESAAEESSGEEPDADSNEAIYYAAMEGVETDVEKFFEGIPVPEDGSIQMGDSTKVDFITSMTIEECVQFYRTTFPELGLVEIEELSNVTDYGATLVFGGYPTGEAIWVKVNELSPTSRKIKVRLVDPADL